MKAGPKAVVDGSPLPFRSSLSGSARFASWCKKFVRVPKGTGAGKPLQLREWQCQLVGSVLDAETQPRIAGWCLPRGQGKSTLLAALALYELMNGGEGASVIVAAVDERQAGIVFGIARRMVELSPELESRIQLYKDRMTVPCRGASFQCLPASPAALEGLDFTLAIVDEIGRIAPDESAWSIIALASGKRERSTLIGIGTPGPNDTNVLSTLRAYADAHPEDTSQVYVEHSAAGYEDHSPDCEHCWELANPALDDFLHRDAMRALLPPKMAESAYRRAKLAQFVTTADDPFVTADAWDELVTGVGVPNGAEVVIALDGSHSRDCTALLVGTVSPTPHFDTVQLWTPAEGQHIDVLAVEDAIRAACKRWNVREVVADPFRWTRSLQVLAAEGIPVAEFPHSPSRLTAATTDLHSGIVNGRISHSGDESLRRHVLAATVIESDQGGLRLGKTSRKRSAEKIDLAACLVMAHSRCSWLSSRPKKRHRSASFAY